MRTTPILRKLQLYALPLVRQPGKNEAPLFYLHAKKLPAGAIKDASYALKATTKAADMWSKLGQANEGTWKRRSYVMGEKFMDRIEYEEWALKSIDPELSPKPWKKLTEGSSTAKGKEKSADSGEDVILSYPASLLERDSLIESLKAHMTHREPHHKSAMRKWLIGTPLTIPFALIPIVPNFPMFYCLWRAWSHWRAWKASSYLGKILSNPSSHLTITSSKILDDIYATSSSTSSNPSPSSSAAALSSSSELLLTREMVPEIVKKLQLTNDEGHELFRAVDQIKTRLEESKKLEQSGEKEVGEKLEKAEPK